MVIVDFGFGTIAPPDKHKQTRRILDKKRKILCGIVSGKKVKWLGHGIFFVSQYCQFINSLFSKIRSI